MDLDERFIRQLNIRVTPPEERELLAISKQTGELYSALIRRLIHEEYERLAARQQEGRG